MADKKYYWLKLKRDFFKRHDIRIIEEMTNGKDYILFYLKLLVESIDHEGELRFSDAIPYNEQMLSVITNTNIDIVRAAMNIFLELGMIDRFDDSTIYMREVQRMIGSETRQAETMRKKRAAKALDGNNVTQVLPESYPDVTKSYIEKEKEIRDKDIDKEDVSIDPSIKDDRVIDSTIINDIQDQIDYDSLISYIDADLVDMAVGIIADFRTAFTPQEFNSRQYAAEFVRQRSYEIDSSHIEHVINLFKHQHEEVRNIRGYLRTMLFNAPETMGAYYTHKVCAEY
jgi:predicted phage replisome organizer